MALDESAVGNTIVKSPELEDLSDPKSRIITLGSPLAVSLKIIAPRAVMVELLHVESPKSVRAVVLELVGVTFTNVLPLAT
jgi:hypothetical protein